MGSSLKDIWKNRKQILEGITNAVIRDEYIEDVSKLRMELCNVCPDNGDECVMPGTSPCCNLCGCSLSFKTRALSSECPAGKWKALMSEKQEDKLDNLN